MLFPAGACARPELMSTPVRVMQRVCAKGWACQSSSCIAEPRERIATDKKVSPENGTRFATGGHGNSALSDPMREDSPAANMTPHQLGARLM